MYRLEVRILGCAASAGRSPFESLSWSWTELAAVAIHLGLGFVFMYVNRHRSSILGPDVSARRNLKGVVVISVPFSHGYFAIDHKTVSKNDGSPS